MEKDRTSEKAENLGSHLTEAGERTSHVINHIS